MNATFSKKFNTAIKIINPPIILLMIFMHVMNMTSCLINESNRQDAFLDIMMGISFGSLGALCVVLIVLIGYCSEAVRKPKVFLIFRLAEQHFIYLRRIRQHCLVILQHYIKGMIIVLSCSGHKDRRIDLLKTLAKKKLSRRALDRHHH